ncbi:MAG: alpha/beta fold hydrolase [Terracidiphilus sp.]
MLQSVEGRELITLRRLGPLVHGTYHRGNDKNSAIGDEKRVGILFLNSLSLPRAATGDSYVYWADCFADSGYPSFRIDLPGLGDSDGNLPQDLLVFINSGGFASVAAQKARELVETFNLSGVIIVGHCAGAVSALFAAGRCAECKGLVLLDVSFHLSQAVRPKIRQKLSSWALNSRLGRFASEVYDRLRQIRLSLMGNRLPDNANVPLLRCWKNLASTGLPILILKAPARKALGVKPRVGKFDYMAHALRIAGGRSQVKVELTEGTDHSFANRLGRSAVQERVEDWLRYYFPIAQKQPSDRLAALKHSVV